MELIATWINKASLFSCPMTILHWSTQQLRTNQYIWMVLFFTLLNFTWELIWLAPISILLSPVKILAGQFVLKRLPRLLLLWQVRNTLSETTEKLGTVLIFPSPCQCPLRLSHKWLYTMRRVKIRVKVLACDLRCQEIAWLRPLLSLIFDPDLLSRALK